MTCLTLLLCCVIAFGSISKPVKAIAGLDDAVYFALAAVVMSLACDIAVDNPATGAELLKLWDALSDGAQQAVQAAADGIVLYGNTVYNWEVETWTNLANEVKSWMDDNHAPVTGVGQVIVTNADGYVGFTDDTYFRLYYPQNTTTAFYGMPSSVIWLYNHVQASSVPIYGCSMFNSSVVDEKINAQMIKSSNGLAFFAYGYDRWGVDYSGKYFAPYWQSDSLGWCLTAVDRTTEHWPFSYSNNSSFFYDYGTGNCYKLKSVSGGYAFVSQSTNENFGGLIFSTDLLAVDWFLKSCGFYTNTTTPDTAQVYTDQSATDGVIDYDPDRTQTAIDNIGDHVVDDQLPMVIPGSDDLLKDIADSPDLVWDVSATGVYTGSIDLPTVPGNLWYDKFPFCVPYDVVRLFTSFAAEPEAPSFHILVLPENSFGFENEAVYFDIDFADYDMLVKILRFFLAAGFVLWLIVMTRKLICG